MNSQDAFLEQYGPWALIAGASKGIGEAFSHQLAEKGLNLILLARGENDLEKTAQEINKKYQVKTRIAALDLSDPSAIDKLKPIVEDIDIGLLVYNAVYSEIGEFFDSGTESKMKTIDVNCRGPILFISEFGEKMIKNRRGGILLMSSMSGFQGTAMVTSYAASKAFITVLGEGLWEEFRRYNVKVLTFVAGATKTPNFNEQTPADKAKLVFPMEPDQVAREAIESLDKGPTRFAGTLNKIVHFVLCRLVSRKNAIKFLSHNTRKLYQA